MVNAIDYYSSNVPPGEYFSWWNTLNKQYLPVLRMIEMLKKQLAHDAPFVPNTLVDLGCGPGTSFPIMAKEFPFQKIFAIDAAPPMLRYLEEHRMKHPFELSSRLCDIENQPFPIDAHSIDIAMSCSTIGYIKNIEHVFHEVSRILKPLGFWTFDCCLHTKSFAELEDKNNTPLTYLHSFKLLKRVSRAHGFKIVRHVRMGDGIFNNQTPFTQSVLLFQKEQ